MAEQPLRPLVPRLKLDADEIADLAEHAVAHAAFEFALAVVDMDA